MGNNEEIKQLVISMGLEEVLKDGEMEDVVGLLRIKLSNILEEFIEEKKNNISHIIETKNKTIEECKILLENVSNDVIKDNLEELVGNCKKEIEHANDRINEFNVLTRKLNLVENVEEVSEELSESVDLAKRKRGRPKKDNNVVDIKKPKETKVEQKTTDVSTIENCFYIDRDINGNHVFATVQLKEGDPKHVIVIEGSTMISPENNNYYTDPRKKREINSYVDRNKDSIKNMGKTSELIKEIELPLCYLSKYVIGLAEARCGVQWKNSQGINLKEYSDLIKSK